MRRNHGQSRRLFYEELIKKMGDDVDIEFSRLKNQAFGALTKKNVRVLDLFNVILIVIFGSVYLRNRPF